MIGIEKLIHFKKESTDIKEKRLLNVKEVCTYLGVGETKARELIRGQNGFGVMIGNRWYADKHALDLWIEKIII